MSKLDELKYSISNLAELARASPKLGLVINLTTAALGLAVWYLTTGLVSWAGMIYAILSVLGIIKWVFNL